MTEEPTSSLLSSVRELELRAVRRLVLTAGAGALLVAAYSSVSRVLPESFYAEDFGLQVVAALLYAFEHNIHLAAIVALGLVQWTFGMRLNAVFNALLGANAPLPTADALELLDDRYAAHRKAHWWGGFLGAFLVLTSLGVLALFAESGLIAREVALPALAVYAAWAGWRMHFADWMFVALHASWVPAKSELASYAKERVSVHSAVLASSLLDAAAQGHQERTQKEAELKRSKAVGSRLDGRD